MHTGHVLLVQAESADDAEQIARRHSEEQGWSDWNEMGGRWSDIVPNSVLRYSENKELFYTTITNFGNLTLKEREETRARIGHLTINEILDANASNETYDADSDKWLCNYFAHRILENSYADRHTPETYVFDVEDYSNDPYAKRALLRCVENPEQQYLVMWDYHF
jgi:hypothetical protein